MAVDVNVTRFEVFNEFKNDIGFASNPADFTNNLAGSVMERVQVLQEIEISWGAESSGSQKFLVEDGGTKMTLETGLWSDFGITSGDNVRITYLDSNNVFNGPFLGVATTVIGAVIYFAVAPVSVTLPTLGNLPESNFSAMKIRAWQPLEALIYKFGLIGNNENTNYISKVSGNEQSYYGVNIGFDTGGGVRDTGLVNMAGVGSYNDWVTGSSKIQYVDNPDIFTQRFRILHEFEIVPYYVEGELDNLENLILPDLYVGGNTLKYVFDFDFRTVISNPNTSKQASIDYLLGSVAWFEENFNGFDNNYNVKSIAYEDAATTSSADGLLIGTKTRATITVENILTPFVGAERFGVYISYLPTQIEYENTISDQVQNFIYDRALNNEGAAFTTGSDFITLCEASIVSGELVIVVELEYSSLQKSFLSGKFASNEARYLIGVQVGDNVLPAGNSDKVMLIADANIYDDSADIAGLMAFDKLDFFQHDIQIGVDSGFTDSVQWNEDGFVVDFDFTLNLNKSAVINNLVFKLVAHNTVTGQLFELDSYNYNSIGGAIVSGGVQQLIDNTTRGYNLDSSDQFNDVTIEVGSQAAGLQHYTGRFAQKVSWQDWLSNTDVDTIFFDASKANNNLNDKTSNYSNLNNYEIKLGISSSVDGVSDFGVSGTTSYLFLSPTLITYDYDLGPNITPVWAGVIETFHPTTGADLGGKVLAGLNTVFKTTWTNSGGAVTDISQVWAVHRIEESLQGGYAIDELSSINPFPVPNRLIPTIGQTQLTVNIVTGTVVTECLVDGSQIVSGQDYNLSARLQDDNILVPATVKLTEQGANKETQEAEFKIIE